MKKKSMIGIGTLIVLISGILVATVAAGVILRTQSQLQNKALEVGSKVKKSVQINFNIESVKLIQDLYGDYTQIKSVMKLGAGSGDLLLNFTYIDLITDNSSAVLRWGGVSESKYFTNRESRLLLDEINLTQIVRLHSDLDADFKEDNITLYNSTLVIINMSDIGEVNITIANISHAGVTLDVYENVTNGTENNGRIRIRGTTTKPDSLINVNVTIYPPYNWVGTGTFSVVMLKRADPDLKAYAATEGDILRFYMETTSAVGEDEELYLSIKQKYGHARRSLFATPDTLIGSNIQIFP